MSEDTRGERFKVGDVILVGCPAARARVVQVTPCEVSVEWPWAQVDPNSGSRWNGHRAIPRTTPAGEWGGLFRIGPRAGRLEVGDSCLVGISETLVRIVDIGRFDPPADVGRLPGPRTMLVVLPVDHPHVPHSGEEGDTIDLENAAPVRIDLLSRG